MTRYPRLVGLGLGAITLFTTAMVFPSQARAADGVAPAAGAPAPAEAPAADAPDAEPPVAPPPVAEAPVPLDPKKSHWGVGARIRYVFVPSGFLNLFLGHSTSMNSVGFGAEAIYRKRPDFDIVFGLEYENVSANEGLYLEKGKNPNNPPDYPDYVQFDNFAFLGVDATFIWHSHIGSRVDFRYGAGIGLGFVLGKVVQNDTVCPPGTTTSDLDNKNHCPVIPGSAHNADVPPVLPIVNLLLGVRIKLVDNMFLNIEGGFRDMFFTGIGVQYIF